MLIWIVGIEIPEFVLLTTDLGYRHEFLFFASPLPQDK